MNLNQFPQMPEDWWPEEGIIVVGRDSSNELGFAITDAIYFANLVVPQIEASLLGLRRALWMAKFMMREDKEALFGNRKFDA